VDTGLFPADSTGVLGTELFYVCGPFSLQAEWAWAQANSALVAGNVSNRSFNGGYVQTSYFLTGEHRSYDRRLGRLGSNYLDGPTTNFWLTRDEEGGLNVGRGAWEIAARYSYLNLNDGPVMGGVMNGLELALNWYLTPNVKVQFEYMTNNRWDLGPGLLSGTVQAFGTRVQLYF
jgi:phosphate-selective porin OprO/OprP